MLLLPLGSLSSSAPEAKGFSSPPTLRAFGFSRLPFYCMVRCSTGGTNSHKIKKTNPKVNKLSRTLSFPLHSSQSRRRSGEALRNHVPRRTHPGQRCSQIDPFIVLTPLMRTYHSWPPRARLLETACKRHCRI